MTDVISTDRHKNGRRRGPLVFLVLLLAMLVTGAVAYNLGLSHGATQAALASGTQVPILPYYYYYYGPRPWGLGFLFPFLFVGAWFLMARAFFWRRHGRGCEGRGGPWLLDRDRLGARLDQWHRQAHERMTPPDAHA